MRNGISVKVTFCPQGLNDANGATIKWQTYEYVTEATKKGQIRKRIKLVYKETPPSTIIPLFQEHLSIFITQIL